LIVCAVVLAAVAWTTAPEVLANWICVPAVPTVYAVVPASEPLERPSKVMPPSTCHADVVMVAVDAVPTLPNVATTFPYPGTPAVQFPATLNAPAPFKFQLVGASLFGLVCQTRTQSTLV